MISPGVASPNGFLRLSVPVRGDGTIDEEESTIVDGVTNWTAVNDESIIGARSSKTYADWAEAS